MSKMQSKFNILLRGREREGRKRDKRRGGGEGEEERGYKVSVALKYRNCERISSVEPT